MNLCRLLCIGCILGCATVARGAPLASQGIGAYGDSLTMQYSLWVPLAKSFGYNLFSNGTQFNWVDELVKSGYNFGPTAVLDGRTYNTYDAAIVGAQTSDVLTDGQISNLQPLVSAGSLHVIVDIIGANDFDNGEYQTIYKNAASHGYNPLTDPAVIAFENTVYSNIAAAVDQTLAENPNQKMILATIPDIGVTPAFMASSPVAAQRAADTLVVQAINAQILSLAASHHFPVLDLYGLAGAATTITSFAGNTMINAGGTSSKDLFLSDGFHLGTVGQGILANMVLQADHLAYGDSVTPITDQQIAKYAGLTPNKVTTTFDVSPYVIYNAPEPATWILALVGGVGAFLAKQARRNRLAGRRSVE